MDSPEVLPDVSPFSPSAKRKRCSRVTTRIWRSAKWQILRMVSIVGYFFLSACFKVADTCCAVIYLIRGSWRIVSSIIFFPAVRWERVFVLSCVAVCLDPLFFYIPIVDDTHKCLTMDKTLRTTALILRSLTDVLLITHIIAQIRDKVVTGYPNFSVPDSDSRPHPDSKHIAYVPDPEFGPQDKELHYLHPLKFITPYRSIIMIKCLAVLPIPQVALFLGFYRLRGSDFFIIRKFVNMSLVLQYLPRICQIYLHKHNFRMAGKWAKPSFNFFLYILASHVLGALWYFFSIQRETTCWHKACKKTPGCAVATTYNCGRTSSMSATVLDQLCPINTPNSTLFDFGMFADILKSGNTGSTNFPEKVLFCLWWGLKNLSNFGTNLETSNYVWENCFAILICVIGLLLFLYLIGTAQLYIQSSTQKSMEKEKARTKRIRETKTQITNWMHRRFGNADLKPVRTSIKAVIREDKVVERNLTHDVDVKYFLDRAITPRIRTPILEHLGRPALRRLPMLEDLIDAKLNSLCEYMEPVIYDPNTNIARPKDMFGKMLFIIEGSIEINISTEPIVLLKKDEYFGEEFLKWASFNYKTKSLYDPPPSSTGFVYSREAKVEALGLKAWDMLRFIEKNVDINSPSLKHLADAYSQPKFVLERQCQIHSQSKIPQAQIIAPLPSPWKSVVGFQTPLSSFKLNCSVWDFNSKHELIGLGCVLRGSKGNFVAARNVAVKPGIDGLEDRALSIMSNLEFCNNKYSYIKMVVECDDLLLIDCINNWSSSSSKDRVRYSLQATLETISKFKNCSFVACDPQSNEAALVVAQNAKRDMQPHFWEVGSDNIGELPEWLVVLTKDNPEVVAPKLPITNAAPATNAAPIYKTNDDALIPKAGEDTNLVDAATNVSTLVPKVSEDANSAVPVEYQPQGSSSNSTALVTANPSAT